MKINLLAAFAFGLLALTTQARKASDEFTPLLSFIDGKDINDKGVRYYLSIRCASLYAYFAGLMQDHRFYKWGAAEQPRLHYVYNKSIFKRY